MKAIQVSEYGGPEVLKLTEADIAKPAAGQVLIRMMAAGVNFVDIQQRRGRNPIKLPFIPGREGAGVVEAIGEGVTSFQPGSRVAFTAAKSYAQMNLVEADKLIPLPSGFSFEQGAAFPLQGMTAHYLLHEFRKVAAGDVALIHAAAGGMGLLLVQWARRMGARVIGTVSTEAKAAIAREAGAHETILYTQQDFVAEVKRMTEGDGADLIIDGVGRTTFAGNLEAAALRGHVVIYGAASGPADPIVPNALMARSLSVCGGGLVNFTRTRDEMMPRAQDVIRGVEEGWLKLKIDRVLPLERASEAHRLLEGRETVGKLLLSISGTSS